MYSTANFLEGLRKYVTEEDIIFIFDEVMTGFRLAQGGAQERLNIRCRPYYLWKSNWCRHACWCIWRKAGYHATYCTTWEMFTRQEH